MITSKVVAHSINRWGDELISYLVTFPRIILSELNTHRMLTKNSASSRAIPFQKNLKSVIDNCFIPIAWQLDHPGMQGNQYIDRNEVFELDGFMKAAFHTLNTQEPAFQESPDYLKKAAVERKKLDAKLAIMEKYLTAYKYDKKTLDQWWLFARDKAVESACILHILGATKQICNRILEPFMWHTVLITGNIHPKSLGNFFELRCPAYSINGHVFKSKKEYIKIYEIQQEVAEAVKYDPLFWFKKNTGKAEIHIMALAESMYDNWKESTPTMLKSGEWHMPFSNILDAEKIRTSITWPGHDSANPAPDSYYLDMMNSQALKISTAMSARTSYTVVGDETEISYERLCIIHDDMANQKPFHASPFEHCAQCMTDDERIIYINGNIDDQDSKGWLRNFRGFKQYRHMVESYLQLGIFK